MIVSKSRRNWTKSHLIPKEVKKSLPAFIFLSTLITQISQRLILKKICHRLDQFRNHKFSKCAQITQL